MKLNSILFMNMYLAKLQRKTRGLLKRKFIIEVTTSTGRRDVSWTIENFTSFGNGLLFKFGHRLL